MAATAPGRGRRRWRCHRRAELPHHSRGRTADRKQLFWRRPRASAAMMTLGTRRSIRGPACRFRSAARRNRLPGGAGGDSNRVRLGGTMTACGYRRRLLIFVLRPRRRRQRGRQRDRRHFVAQRRRMLTAGGTVQASAQAQAHGQLAGATVQAAAPRPGHGTLAAGQINVLNRGFGGNASPPW